MTPTGDHHSDAEERSDADGPRQPASPVDWIIDLGLYAPVGLVKGALEDLPEWVERGRREVESRLSTAKVVGRLAVDQGSRQSGELLRRVAAQADTLLANLGLAPDSPGPATTEAPGPTATDTGTATPSSSPSAGSAPTDLDPAQLAIPGYDTLSASQVVQRLAGLAPEELDAVRAYEVAGRARKTILLKIAQLQPGS